MVMISPYCRMLLHWWWSAILQDVGLHWWWSYHHDYRFLPLFAVPTLMVIISPYCRHPLTMMVISSPQLIVLDWFKYLWQNENIFWFVGYKQPARKILRKQHLLIKHYFLFFGVQIFIFQHNNIILCTLPVYKEKWRQ